MVALSNGNNTLFGDLMKQHFIHVKQMLKINKEYLEWIDSHPDEKRVSSSKREVSTGSREIWLLTLERMAEWNDIYGI